MNNISTVGQLIEMLQEYDPDMKVAIGYNYGGLICTTMAEGICQVVEQDVEHSDYHHSNIVCFRQGEDENADRAVVISTVWLDEQLT